MPKIKEKSTHTPTPWKAVGTDILGDDQRLIAQIVDDEGGKHSEESFLNAEYLVKAVNSYNAMQKALIKTLAHLKDQGYMAPGGTDYLGIENALNLSNRQ